MQLAKENATFRAYAVAGKASIEEIGDYRRADVSPGLRLKETGRVVYVPLLLCTHAILLALLLRRGAA